MPDQKRGGCVEKAAGDLGRLKPGCFRTNIGVWLGDASLPVRSFALSHRRKEIMRELRHIARAKRVLTQRYSAADDDDSKRPYSAPALDAGAELTARSNSSSLITERKAHSDGAVSARSSTRLPQMRATPRSSTPPQRERRAPSLFDACPFVPPCQLLQYHTAPRRGEASVQAGLANYQSPSIERILPQAGLNAAGKRLSFRTLDPFVTTSTEHYVPVRKSNASWVLHAEMNRGSGVFAKYMQNCIEKNVECFKASGKEK